LRSNAATYQLNPAKVGIWGARASGHLAALTGLTTGRTEFQCGQYADQSSGVLAVADLFGPTDLTASDLTCSNNSYFTARSARDLRKTHPLLLPAR
jgi:acetyl esterase/lipase